MLEKMDDEELLLLELSSLDLLALPEEDEPNKDPKMPEEDEEDNDGEDVTEDVIEEGDKEVVVAVVRV